jgi:hypothetical protein
MSATNHISMTLAVELTEDEEARLRSNASAEGKAVEDYVRGLIARLPAPRQSADRGITAGALLIEQLRADDAIGIWKHRDDSPELSRQLRRRIGLIYRDVSRRPGRHAAYV